MKVETFGREREHSSQTLAGDESRLVSVLYCYESKTNFCFGFSAPFILFRHVMGPVMGSTTDAASLRVVVVRKGAELLSLGHRVAS